MVAMSLKKRMLSNGDKTVKIPRATISANFPLAGNSQSCPVFDARGYTHADLAAFGRQSCTIAPDAWVSDVLAPALARGTCDLNLEDGLNLPNSSNAPAGAAFSWPCSWFTAGSFAGFAKFAASDFDGLFHAENGLFKIDGYLEPEACPSASSTSAKQISEDVTK
jgi:hypothetical protein